MQSEINFARPTAHVTSAFSDELMDGHLTIHATIQQILDRSLGAMSADAVQTDVIIRNRR